jgi:hypothetical protein
MRPEPHPVSKCAYIMMHPWNQKWPEFIRAAPPGRHALKTVSHHAIENQNPYLERTVALPDADRNQLAVSRPINPLIPEALLHYQVTGEELGRRRAADLDSLVSGVFETAEADTWVADGAGPGIRLRAPHYGEHNHEVLAGPARYGPDEIEALYAAGVVGVVPTKQPIAKALDLEALIDKGSFRGVDPDFRERLEARGLPVPATLAPGLGDDPWDGSHD